MKKRKWPTSQPMNQKHLKHQKHQEAPDAPVAPDAQDGIDRHDATDVRDTQEADDHETITSGESGYKDQPVASTSGAGYMCGNINTKGQKVPEQLKKLKRSSQCLMILLKNADISRENRLPPDVHRTWLIAA